MLSWWWCWLKDCEEFFFDWFENYICFCNFLDFSDTVIVVFFKDNDFIFFTDSKASFSSMVSGSQIAAYNFETLKIFSLFCKLNKEEQILNLCRNRWVSEFHWTDKISSVNVLTETKSQRQLITNIS